MVPEILSFWYRIKDKTHPLLYYANKIIVWDETKYSIVKYRLL